MSRALAYAIGHITIKDADKWLEYCNQVPGTLMPWRGEILFRAKTLAPFSGEHSHKNVVVLRFPGTDALNQWYQSEAYQKLIPLRDQAADVTLIAYEA